MNGKRACYIAGPMRSRPEFNYPAFMAAARRLRAAGWHVFNPAEMDIKYDQPDPEFLHMTVEEQKAHASAYTNARRYARRDCQVIINKLRAEDGDAIVVLPGWKKESVGARGETALAEWVGLRRLTVAQAERIGRGEE